MKKIALITGITGQDGSYLSELLLKKGYDVHGIVRRTSQNNRGRIETIREKALEEGKIFELHYGDLGDSSSLHRIFPICKPTEVYNLAAQSHVWVSFDQPEYTTDIDGTGVLRLLEAIRQTNTDCRFYQASTSELFGKVHETPQTEETPFHPRSTYGVAKMYAYWIVKHYREAYNFHCTNGILFNHESPRRGENFVTRKITYSLARILAGKQRTLKLGNIDAKRDWGYAKDYCYMMWRMLQEDTPDDYVVATGQTHSVREFIMQAAPIAGFDLIWEGSGVNEKGIDLKTNNIIIEIDPQFYRPTEVDLLLGDSTKAKNKLGWTPKVKFEELVKIMMKADIELVYNMDISETTVPI